MTPQMEMYQNKEKNKQSGYTLLEGIIVLSLVMIMVSMAILPSASIIQQKKIDFFLEQLEKDILFAQSYAISHHERIYLRTTQDNHRYSVINIDGDALIVRNYDTSIRIEHLTTENPITFYSNGNVKRAGTLHIKSYEKIYKLVFLLGKGRFYVKEI